jgi:vancomycin resistance protein YoaR
MTTYPAGNTPYYSAEDEIELNPWAVVPVLGVVGTVLLIVILGVLVAFFRYSYAGQITPGVSVAGVDLGGMTREEAIRVLEQQFFGVENAVYTFSTGTQPELDALFVDNPQLLRRSAAELGVRFDAGATVDAALAHGSDGDLASSLVEQGLTWLNGESIAPVIRYDQAPALEYLATLAARIDREPTPYNARLDGSSVVMGEAGRKLDVDATLRELNRALTGLQPQATIPLVVYEINPPTQVTNAEEVAQVTEVALSGPLTLTAEDAISGAPLGPWEITQAQIESLLQVELVDNGDGTTRYEVAADMSAFRESLEELAPGLRARPADGRFHFDPVSRELVVIQPAVNGREVDIEETIHRLEQAVFRADNRTVPIAFDYTLPRYHDNLTAAELGITEMVVEATTYYTGSEANRRHNIAEGASRFDGVIIGPGEEFSFNYWLGDLSFESGFKEGKVIVGGRTVGGIGGGICQVSTTVFRAAFAGGYQIVERNSHAYRVGYYELNGPPGLDAAIWTPERDFRFQNDTDYHLLIETAIYPAENAIQFRFYSTNPGRVVEIETPTVRNVVEAPPVGYEANRDIPLGQSLQVDYAAEGADVNVKRIIRDMQGNVLTEDNIFTHYLPWQAIFQVNPNDSRLNS